jgi:Na+/melibiose symporter-like transporter
MAILVRFLISLYEVPSSALLAELTHDYDERTSMFGYRYFFGWTGGLSMTMLGFGVFFHASPRFPQGQLDPANYPANALTACIVMVVAIFVSAFGTQKFSAPPDRKLSLRGILMEMWESMKNRSFLVVTLTALFSSTAAGVVTNHCDQRSWNEHNRKQVVLTLSHDAEFPGFFATRGTIQCRFVHSVPGEPQKYRKSQRRG